MIRTNRAKFALLSGVVLALTAGSVAYGAADILPPPAPPVPPSPPAPPAPPELGQQIVIVERHGGDDGKDYVRTITRDGKTFVFQTDRALSDAEIEQRIASAEARIPPVPPVPPVSSHDRRVMKQRVIVMNENGEDVTDVVTEEGDEHCNGKRVVSDVDTSAQDDGKLTRVRIRMCGTPGDFKKHAMAEAIDGIRKARAEIAGDKSLSESIRLEILRDLDAEIERLRNDG